MLKKTSEHFLEKSIQSAFGPFQSMIGLSYIAELQALQFGIITLSPNVLGPVIISSHSDLENVLQTVLVVS